MPDNATYLAPLLADLEEHSLKFVYKNEILRISSKNKSIDIYFGEASQTKKELLHIPVDYAVTRHKKILPIILSKLNLNKTIFARNCIIQTLDKKTATDFFDTWHFFDSTSSAYNYGLFYKDELVGAASFSKGRNMDRLPKGRQSFELIRFCCKSGITVTGGLSKLMNYFCIEKKAGDVMTYINKQFSNGDSFIKAGFKKGGETSPLYFLIHKKTFKRSLLKDKNEKFDTTLFYRLQNAGNIKLIYTPDEK